MFLPCINKVYVCMYVCMYVCISGALPHLERRIYTYLVLLPEHTCYDRYSLSRIYSERHAFCKKNFWCFSTFRTKNIHIYLVCYCQSTLATIDIPFRASITNRTRFIENIPGVSPHLERRIYTYILSVAASALLL